MESWAWFLPIPLPIVLKKGVSFIVRFKDSPLSFVLIDREKNPKKPYSYFPRNYYFKKEKKKK